MKKNYLCIKLLVASCVFICSCASVSSKYAENVEIHNFLRGSGERYTVIASDEETERLRDLLKLESGWSETEPCLCADEDVGYDVLLDGVYYRVCNWHSMAFLSDEIHSISYKNSANEEYKHAMLNENEDIMREIYDLVSNRAWYGTSFDIFLEEHQKKTNEAIIRPMWAEDTSRDIFVSKEDTKRLRKLLSIESGWKQNYQCMCIGHDELILDNVGYIIDLTDVDHQIKYCEVGKESYYCAIENENKDIVQEIYDIVEKYVD